MYINYILYLTIFIIILNFFDKLFCLFYLIFLFLIIWRFNLLIFSIISNYRNDVSECLSIDDSPKYSMLIPLYNEATMMSQLCQAVRAIDWPDEKLDIQLLIEADDTCTAKAASQARFRRGVRITRVPEGSRRTKPNALNYGLEKASGEFLCIYDAEDRPAPDQLKRAYAHFSRLPERIACLQAPLIADFCYRNNWLAGHWALEYAVQFGILIPVLAKLDLPILLAGTSNHFRMQVLRDVGGWDADNVTEDAELGIRLYRSGYRTRMICAATLEAPPDRIRDWLPQRSRWIKGFLQTWLRHMSRPDRALSDLGWRGFIGVSFCLGGAIVSAFMYLPLTGWVLLCLILPQADPGAIGWGLFVTGYLTGALSDGLAPGPWSVMRVFLLFTRPFYWCLHSLAAYRAAWELIYAPLYWAKTPHRPLEIS